MCVCVFLFWFLFPFHRAGYLDQGLLVRDAAKLRKHYFTTKGWRLDFLSVLPTDFAYFWWMPGKCHIQVPCPVIVRLNRLFRLPRMLEWFERTETATGYPNAFRICKVRISLFFLLLLLIPFLFWFLHLFRFLIAFDKNLLKWTTLRDTNWQSNFNSFTGCFSDFSFNPLECLFVLCD